MASRDLSLRDRIVEDLPFAAAGVLAGVLFGLYGGPAMLETISRLAYVAEPDATVGWAVHVLMSAIFGVGYAEASRLVRPGPATVPMFGLLYGVALWVGGPLLVMPLALGETGAVLDVGGAVGSLWGHLIYGAVLQATGQVCLFLATGGARAAPTAAGAPHGVGGPTATEVRLVEA